MTGETPATPAVEFFDAAVAVGGRVIWSGVSLAIPQGEFVAILGANGVGKSTLVKAVLGLLPLSEGSVRILGEPPDAVRKDVGYLPQRRSFDAGLRIRGLDIVQLGLDGARWGVPFPGRRKARRLSQQRVAELIDLVGATGYARRPIGELSGGEQQRLLIAQALAHHPKVLLLDEPLDSLDLTTQASVAGLVSDICSQEGVTVMMVAHDVNPILSYLDRVVYLAGGGAVQGTPEEVITSQTLSRLYNTPIEVLTTASGQLVVVGQPDATAAHRAHHHPSTAVTRR